MAKTREPPFVIVVKLIPPDPHVEINQGRGWVDSHESLLRTKSVEIFMHSTRPPYGTKGHIDLQALAQALTQVGATSWERVDYPFASVVLEPAYQRLTLARDFGGRSSLYYVLRAAEVIVSNNLFSLIDQAGLPFRVSGPALDLYWGLGFIPAPHSIIDGVRKVPSGTAIVFESGHVRTVPFFPRAEAHNGSRQTAEEVLEETELRLRRSLEAVTANVGRVCLLLSGGVDSSLVGHLLRRIGKTSVVAASVVAGVEDASDRPARVAAALGLRHHAICLPAFSIEKLAGVLAHIDEPCSDTMLVPLTELMEGVSGIADLCVSGIGADSLFFGLNSHLALDQWEHGYEIDIAAKQQLGPRAAVAIASDLKVLRSAPDIGTGWARMFESMSIDDRVALTDGNAHRKSIESVVPDFVREWCGDTCGPDRLAQFDAEVPMADSTLQLVRQVANSARLAHDSPFLTTDFYLYTRRLPRRELIQHGVGKVPLRRLVERLVPSEEWRLPKIGFRLPLVRILEEHRTSIEEIVQSIDCGGVNSQVVQRWVQEFFRGQAPRSYLSARRIWRVLTWALWHHAHTSRQIVSPQAPMQG
jgi:asparagine synthase (glutamine-hydrolysing)